LAAVKMAHHASGGAKEADDGPLGGGGGFDNRDRPQRDGPPRDGPRNGPPRGNPRALEGAVARMYVGAGRGFGIRPQDLVGAITGEAGITGDQIGAIEIADRFSIVELPEAVIDQVILAMSNTTLKGRKVAARRFVER
jgi:ATP-dependent RNA helicase DeaD